MLASVNAVAAADAQIVHHPDDLAVGGVIGEFNWAGGDATVAIDAIFIYGLNDWSQAAHNFFPYRIRLTKIAGFG
jgi:hypothetical protein